MRGALETLVAAAVRAPSGDNTQPWRFVVDSEARRIAVYVDETKDVSPMNAAQRMARIAVGAAVENLLVAARDHDWSAELEHPPCPALALVRLRPGYGNGAAIQDVVAARVTNRRLYDGRPMPARVIRALEQRTPAMGGVRTHWMADRDRVGELARLVGRADALVFGERAMRQAFLSKVRFDAASGGEVEEGLSPEALELSGAERLGLRAMRNVPDRLLKLGGAMRAFAQRARKLVESASGLCLVVAEDAAAETDVLVGRALEQAWLELTAQGLAAQPMMSLLIVENVLEQGPPAVVASLEREGAEDLLHELRGLVPEVGEGRPAALMRFGCAPRPSGRTGRLPVRAVAVEKRLDNGGAGNDSVGEVPCNVGGTGVAAIARGVGI